MGECVSQVGRAKTNDGDELTSGHVNIPAIEWLKVKKGPLKLSTYINLVSCEVFRKT